MSMPGWFLLSSRWKVLGKRLQNFRLEKFSHDITSRNDSVGSGLAFDVMGNISQLFQ